MSVDSKFGHCCSASVLSWGGFVFLVYLFGFLCLGSGSHGPRRRSDDVVCQPFEVLDGGGKQELIPCARETAQSQPVQRMSMLYFSKQTLDLLSIYGRLAIGVCVH